MVFLNIFSAVKHFLPRIPAYPLVERYCSGTKTNDHMIIETQTKISSLSIFFPAYNDGGTIPSMVLTAQIAVRDH